MSDKLVNRKDHIYSDQEMDLSFYENNTAGSVENLVLPIEVEKKMAKADVLNRFSGVLGQVKIERF